MSLNVDISPSAGAVSQMSYRKVCFAFADLPDTEN